jgi:heme-degrading monooxygenase HmoA
MIVANLPTETDTMIVEIADFKVRPEQRAQFLQAITGAATTILAKATGYRGHRILACQESPGRVVLTVEWETLEAHTVGFRQSPAFTEWRAVIGPFFLEPPHVEHFDITFSA